MYLAKYICLENNGYNDSARFREQVWIILGTSELLHWTGEQGVNYLSYFQGRPYLILQVVCIVTTGNDCLKER